ncbi:DUF342 domain-containing protein [Vibrio mimicus]|uniref:DUF342 domain-containing protein n=1 Tax=Vibrio mimicus TaxID=674 RepID=UPI00076B6504|nr:DUF342 domain-containing protein [Vibrio mimicus]AMG01676.1 DUF342 domain-containing protein [Vibrio mimicus]KAA3492849.1 DUF342 domain-containing protein [Vibrio mimicus]
MWKEILELTPDRQKVIAKLGAQAAEKELNRSELPMVLAQIGAGKLFVLDEEVTRFINCVKEGKRAAFEGIAVAEIRNATVSVVLGEKEMLASMVVTGAYGGRGLRGNELVHALAQARVIKGINKLALKKVLLVSNQLKPGEVFTQPVARGKEPIQGRDTQFVPLVEDVSKRVLRPQKKAGENKLDMRNLGETITVGENDPVMRRLPATKGEMGYTVQGKQIPPKPGKESVLVAGKGTYISPNDPNLLLASQAGMPLIKKNTIEVDSALCLNHVSVATGHIRFKGNVVIAGDVEPGMIVRATGSITVGGFIESANVQAQGDIEVGKGIIGHTVADDEEPSCVVKSGANIRANYAQYAELQAADSIHLAVHSMGNVIRCGNDLIVLDSKQTQGTLSAGNAKVGGKILCFNLGVEGDTATHIEAFARYQSYKERINKHKDLYKQAQDTTMALIRREIEFKKRPKAERGEDEAQTIETAKVEANTQMEKIKLALDMLNEEFEQQLAENTVEAKNKVFTHVTIQFGDERILTKRAHGPSTFTFNQHEIKFSSLLEAADIGI